MKNLSITISFLVILLCSLLSACGNNAAERNRQQAEAARQRFAQLTALTGGVEYKSFRATITSQGKSFSQPYLDAPSIHVNDLRDSVLIGAGNDRLILKPSSHKGIYEAQQSLNGHSLSVKAFRAIEAGQIDSVSIDGQVADGSATIFYKPAV